MLSFFQSKGWRTGRCVFWLSLCLLGVADELPLPIEVFALVVLVLILSSEILLRYQPLNNLKAELTAWSDFLLLVLYTSFIPNFYIFFILFILSTSTLKSRYHLMIFGFLSILFGAILTLLYDFPYQNFVLFGLVLVLSLCLALFFKKQWDGVSERQYALEKKLESRSDYFLMRAHEIRTPLTLIQASIELILDGAPGPLTKQQRKFLYNVEENSQNINFLVENMLTQSKLESGIFQPVFQDADVRTIIRAVTADAKTFSMRRNQIIRTHYPQVLPLMPLDSQLLKQAINNLVQNAIKHTSEGGSIDISVLRNDRSILISVTDDGAGMTLEQRKKIFQRFEASPGGTGLGLMIVKQITELHHGRVYSDTNLGRGTTFMISLPLPKHLVREQV